jgi:hypothetical protein
VGSQSLIWRSSGSKRGAHLCLGDGCIRRQRAVVYDQLEVEAVHEVHSGVPTVLLENRTPVARLAGHSHLCRQERMGISTSKGGQVLECKHEESIEIVVSRSRVGRQTLNWLATASSVRGPDVFQLFTDGRART